MEANQQEAQSAQNADMRALDDIWSTMRPDPKANALWHILIAVQERKEAQEAYDAAIREAKDAGASVIEIAEYAGISRTAVYKQLGRKEGQ